MNEEKSKIEEAKLALNTHIKFLESLLTHLNGNDEIIKCRAMFTAYCLHQYVNNGLMNDIEKAISDNIGASNDE